MPVAHCAATKISMRRLSEMPAPPVHLRSRQNCLWRIMKPVSLALGALFGATFGTAAMALPVTWTFIETGCTSSNGGCQNLQLPAAEGHLSLPDINSSGTYHFFRIQNTVTETGDTDFSFQWPPSFEAPPPGQMCAGPASICQWDVDFASSNSGLGVAIHFSEDILSNNIDIGATGGMIGSDALMPGCGTFAQCSVTGFWALTAVPEPSSFTVLGMVIAAFALRLRQRRTVAFTRDAASL
jgi:PEP-CTERM motif